MNKCLGYSKFTAFAVVLAILCTGINVRIFLTVEGPQPPMRFRDLGGLKRPNQFIGLERVRLPVVAPDPYKIYPNLLARVNKLEPKRAYSDDPKRFAAWGKMVPPEDKQFKVTSQASPPFEHGDFDSYPISRSPRSSSFGQLAIRWRIAS